MKKVVAKLAAGCLVVGLVATGTGSVASAATSSDLLYSTDGGASWSSSVTVAPSGTVLVRQWFDNDGTAAETSASVSTEIPTGFTRTGGSTQVCLNPSTTNPSSPDASELVCASSNEGAVWSGPNLQVSTTAGLFGQSSGQTSGILEMGKKRRLNLHQCAYRTVPAMDDHFTTYNIGGPFFSGTNASNAVDVTPDCGAGPAGWENYNFSKFVSLDLLGNRHVNLHQCAYRTNPQTDVVVAGTPEGPLHANTNASNVVDGSVDCGAGTMVFEYFPGFSDVSTMDLLGSRYLNIHQCSYRNSSLNDRLTRISSNGTFTSGTNASNVADAAVDCGPGNASYPFEADHSKVQAVDLLDAARGRGFVEYALTAPPEPTPEACAGGLSGAETFDHEGSLTSTPGGTQSDAGAITVDWTLLGELCPEDPIPMVDPMVAGPVLAASAVIGGYVLSRRRELGTL